jgi:hypothetical protein
LLRQTKRNEEKRREKREEKTTEIFFIKKNQVKKAPNSTKEILSSL